MSEEKECEGEFCAVNILPTGEEVKEKEKLPENAEIASVLGALTASCSLLEEEGTRNSCFSKIEPLEQRTKTTKETLKDIIVEHGEKELMRSIEAIGDLVEEVKKELIDEGKLPEEEVK